MSRRSLRRTTQLAAMSDDDEDDDMESRSGTPLIAPSPSVNIDHLKKRLERQLHSTMNQSKDCTNSNKTSPGLTLLRNTPGQRVKNQQALLANKHHSAKSRAQGLGVGGGVCIWPQMDNMRLTKLEVVMLIVSSVVLLAGTLYMFNQLHGELLADIAQFHQRVVVFHEEHEIRTEHTNNELFKNSVTDWHYHFTNLLNEIHSRFDVSLASTAWTYKLYFVMYVIGIGMLLYFLADNMFSQSKLTPRKIKIWVSLLVTLCTWTVLMMYLLMKAQSLEGAIEACVYDLHMFMGILVTKKFDLSTYQHVCSYWSIRILPPTTRGTLMVMGTIAVRDVSYYLLYYSLPVLTALLTPVIKLLILLKDVYSVKQE